MSFRQSKKVGSGRLTKKFKEQRQIGLENSTTTFLRKHKNDKKIGSDSISIEALYKSGTFKQQSAMEDSAKYMAQLGRKTRNIEDILTEQGLELTGDWKEVENDPIEHFKEILRKKSEEFVSQVTRLQTRLLEDTSGRIQAFTPADIEKQAVEISLSLNYQSNELIRIAEQKILQVPESDPDVDGASWQDYLTKQGLILNAARECKNSVTSLIRMGQLNLAATAADFPTQRFLERDEENVAEASRRFASSIRYLISSIDALPNREQLLKKKRKRDKRKTRKRNRKMGHLLETPVNNFSLDELEFGDHLGKGAFGDVFKGQWRGTTTVAVKQLKGDLLEERDRLNFLDEAELMRRLPPHPNIVGCLGMCVDGQDCYLVLEFVPNGCLKDYLKRAKQDSHFRKDTLLELAKGIAAGMDHLEVNKIVHRDLALRNILLEVRGSGEHVAKVSDFGLAKVELSNSGERKRDGKDKIPISWASPEALRKNHFTSKSDVWAFGIVLWEIYSWGNTPYASEKPVVVMKSILDGEKLEQPEGCPDEVYAIMLKCWAMEPNDRPTFRVIYNELREFQERNYQLLNENSIGSLQYLRATANGEELSEYGVALQLVDEMKEEYKAEQGLEEYASPASLFQDSPSSFQSTSELSSDNTDFVQNVSLNDPPPLHVSQSDPPQNNSPYPNLTPNDKPEHITTIEEDDKPTTPKSKDNTQKDTTTQQTDSEIPNTEEKTTKNKALTKGSTEELTTSPSTERATKNRKDLKKKSSDEKKNTSNETKHNKTCNNNTPPKEVNNNTKEKQGSPSLKDNKEPKENSNDKSEKQNQPPKKHSDTNINNKSTKQIKEEKLRSYFETKKGEAQTRDKKENSNSKKIKRRHTTTAKKRERSNSKKVHRATELYCSNKTYVKKSCKKSKQSSFPSPKSHPNHDSKLRPNDKSPQQQLYDDSVIKYVVTDFVPFGDNQLKVSKGDTLTLIHHNPNHSMCQVRTLDGREGLVPRLILSESLSLKESDAKKNSDKKKKTWKRIKQNVKNELQNSSTKTQIRNRELKKILTHKKVYPKLTKQETKEELKSSNKELDLKIGDGTQFVYSAKKQFLAHSDEKIYMPEALDLSTVSFDSTGTPQTSRSASTSHKKKRKRHRSVILSSSDKKTLKAKHDDSDWSPSYLKDPKKKDKDKNKQKQKNKPKDKTLVGDPSDPLRNSFRKSSSWDELSRKEKEKATKYFN